MRLDPNRPSRRGNYTMLMGIALMAVIGFAVIAVDISLIAMAEMQAQATADSASHAALVAHRNSVAATPEGKQADAKAAADYMLVRNEVGLGTADLDAIRYGIYDPSTRNFCEGCGINGSVNAVELDLSRKGGNAMGLMLAPIIGVETHELAASATVAQQKRAIMLVQDLSGSMSNGAPPRPIDLSRRASVLFLDYMTEYAQSGDMLGLAGYADYGVLGPAKVDVDFGTGAGIVRLPPGSALPPLTGIALSDAISDTLFGQATLQTDRPFIELSDVAADQAFLRTMFSTICSPALGCPDDVALTGAKTDTPRPLVGAIGNRTNPSIAMYQAINEFAAKTDDSYFRGMVVMSDGLFNAGGGAPAAEAAATYAWDTYHIHIWAVLFYDGSFSADQMKSLVRGYGTYSETPSADDLPAIYAGIAASLPTAIVD